MKIQYNGDSAVDIPGIDGVQPGQVVDVPDEVGESLLLAGATFAADGPPILPAHPSWSRPGKKSTPDPARPPRSRPGKKSTPDPADAVKE